MWGLGELLVHAADREDALVPEQIRALRELQLVDPPEIARKEKSGWDFGALDFWSLRSHTSEMQQEQETKHGD